MLFALKLPESESVMMVLVLLLTVVVLVLVAVMTLVSLTPALLRLGADKMVEAKSKIPHKYPPFTIT